MSHIPKKPVKPKAKFGSVLGIAPGGVPVYSSDYESATKEDLPDREAYRSYINNIFLGYKWQCVELARRWLYLNHGYIFGDVSMAHDIFQLKFVTRVADGQQLPLNSFKNGSKRHPETGTLLIWEEGGEFRITGHVAIIHKVFPNKITFIEQNVEDSIWPVNQGYSRALAAHIDNEGRYWIDCVEKDTEILGWVMQTADATHAETIKPTDKKLFNIIKKHLPHDHQISDQWLDTTQPDEAAYVAMMGGHKLVAKHDDRHTYYCITKTADKELRRATNELHAMYMHATHYVLKDDQLLEKFCIPQRFWQKLHDSWDNRRSEMITGRFDLSLSENGLKLYEYNADSASCYMEAGKVQLKWAEHYHCKEGRASGDNLFDFLVHAWQTTGIEETLHILFDDDPEEIYHALYMKSAIEAAGIRAKPIKGVCGFKYNADGKIIDADGEIVSRVWKTWAWETALDQIRLDPNETLESINQNMSSSIRLADILLKTDVLVYEPFWTLIPSNKAILPILWMLYPNHPYLLNSQFELNDELRNKGYVVKPITGRFGSNIQIYGSNNQLLSRTTGRFDSHDVIYQELFTLPSFDNHNVQINTFSVDGIYAGACTRVNTNMILTTDSDIYPLRVIP